jgi:DNA topoisomerase-3
LTSAELTARLELNLSEIENGGRSPEIFIGETADYVRDVTQKAQDCDLDVIYPNENPLGKCPLCRDKKVYEKSWFYACETNRSRSGCGLLLWKNSYGRYLNRKAAIKLLEEGKTGELDGFRNANGQPYKSQLVLEGNRVRIEPTCEPEEHKFEVNQEPLVRCPVCKTSAVIESPTHFICESRKLVMESENTESQCPILPKMICKREMTREETIQYMTTGETSIIDDFISKRGRQFRAKLKLRSDGKHKFEFPSR